MSAPRELVIEVTADDIRLGERHSVCLCPVARAAARALGRPVPSEGGIFEATILASAITVDAWGDGGDPGTWDLVTWWLPEEATQFVTDFDSGRPVAPATFTALLRTAP